MAKRLIAVCLCVIAVFTPANRVRASELDADSPTALRRIRMLGSGTLLGVSLLCEEVGETHQTVPVQLYVHGQDSFSSCPLIQPEISVLPVHALDDKIFNAEPISITLGYGPRLAVAHLSPAQHQIILAASLRGAHPVLTLKPDGYVWQIYCGGRGFTDCDGSIGAALAKQYQRVQGYEVVQIDEDAAETQMKPDDDSILPLFDGDGIWPGTNFSWGNLSWEEIARGPHRAQMPLDSSNWIIPGLLVIELVFRPIESSMASHDGAEYVFAKPNGEMIVLNDRIHKCEVKAGTGQRRKALAKRYRDTTGTPAAIGKGE